MKPNDPLRHALQQVADEETPSVVPHVFSEKHEQQMTALFKESPSVRRSRWVTVLLPLAACLAVVAVIGWDQEWWQPDQGNGHTQSASSTTKPPADMEQYSDGDGAEAGSYRPTDTSGGNSADNSNDICHFAATVRVTAVCDGWLEYAVVDDSSRQITGYRLLVENPAAYAAGDILLIGYSAHSFSADGLTPESINRWEE